MGRHATYLAMAALAVAQVSFVTPVFAQPSEAIEAARRVNISGRQRMLSQRISKAACFLHIGAQTVGKENQLAEAIVQFETSLQALQRGNVVLALGPEQSVDIRDALLVVADDWAAFSEYLQPALSTGVVARATLAELDSSGLALLADMNRAVNKTASYYGDSLPDMPLILSLTIDLAGRQRMLTQKAAKEFCLIEAGVEVAQNRERLAETSQIFSLTLGALQSGMASMVMAAPNDEIRAQLLAVADAWTAPKAALEAAARGEAPTETQRADVVDGLERVLALMNEAVGMYEGAIPQ